VPSTERRNAAVVLPSRYRERVTLRPSEVAALTGLSVKTIHDLLDAGVLRRIKVRHAVLIPVDDVLRLLAGDARWTAGELPLTPRAVDAARALRRKLRLS